MIVVVGMVAGLFWFWVKPWVDAPTRFSEANIWLKPLITFIVLITLTGFAFMFFRNRKLQILISAVISLPFLWVFGFNQFYLGALALAILIFMYAAKNIQAEANERTKINISVIMQSGLPAIITPILILISFAFYFSPGTQASATSKQLPPTIKQVIEKTVGVFFGEQLNALPSQERQQTESQLVAEVIKKFTDFLEPYFQFFPPVLAFGLFLVLQGLSFLFVWLGLAVSVLLFWLFKKSGLVKINLVQKQAEELEF